MENMKQDIQATKRSVVNLKDDLQELGTAAKALANDSVQSVKENISGIYEKGQKKIASVEDQMEGRIKKNPLQAMLIAAGIGLVIGMLRK